MAYVNVEVNRPKVILRCPQLYEDSSTYSIRSSLKKEDACITSSRMCRSMHESLCLYQSKQQRHSYESHVFYAFTSLLL